MIPKFYLLRDRKAVPVDSLEQWAREFNNTMRRVAFDKIGAVEISTVFLGMNHRFGGGGPPLLFETMVFGGEHDQFQDRYSTWEKAEAGHARILQMIKEEPHG